MDEMSIISDGTAEGTHVYLDDHEVRGATTVNWTFSPQKRTAIVTMEISNFVFTPRYSGEPA